MGSAASEKNTYSHVDIVTTLFPLFAECAENKQMNYIVLSLSNLLNIHVYQTNPRSQTFRSIYIAIPVPVGQAAMYSYLINSPGFPKANIRLHSILLCSNSPKPTAKVVPIRTWGLMAFAMV